MCTDEELDLSVAGVVKGLFGSLKRDVFEDEHVNKIMN